MGSFDITCKERLPLGVLRDMILTPVQLSLRTTLSSDFDAAWLQLVKQDQEVFRFTSRKQGASVTDPDQFKIPFPMFMKLLKETDFSKYLQPATVFGSKGQFTLIPERTGFSS